MQLVYPKLPQVVEGSDVDPVVALLFIVPVDGTYFDLNHFVPILYPSDQLCGGIGNFDCSEALAMVDHGQNMLVFDVEVLDSDLVPHQPQLGQLKLEQVRQIKLDGVRQLQTIYV